MDSSSGQCCGVLPETQLLSDLLDNNDHNDYNVDHDNNVDEHDELHEHDHDNTHEHDNDKSTGLLGRGPAPHDAAGGAV